MSTEKRDQKTSLEDLDRRIQAARDLRAAREGRGPGDRAQSEGMAVGLRIAVELAAALLVGAGIGLLLDYWLGTRPWMLVLFFILGTAAGFLNVYRTSQELDRRARERKSAERDKHG